MVEKSGPIATLEISPDHTLVATATAATRGTQNIISVHSIPKFQKTASLAAFAWVVSMPTAPHGCFRSGPKRNFISPFSSVFSTSPSASFSFSSFPPTALCFSPDSRLLLSASPDPDYRIMPARTKPKGSFHVFSALLPSPLPEVIHSFRASALSALDGIRSLPQDESAPVGLPASPAHARSCLPRRDT